MKQSRADILHGRKCSYCVFSPQAAADDLKWREKVEKWIVLVAHWQHVFYSIYVGIVLRVLKRIKLIVLLSFFS